MALTAASRPPDASAHTDTVCRNCEAPLNGSYCSQCGQKTLHVHVSLHDFLHEATHEFLHLDGKIVRTLKLLLFAPGALTNEFMAGRRARYIGPIRLYLTCSLLFFTVATFVSAYGAPTRRAPVAAAVAASQPASSPEGASVVERLRRDADREAVRRQERREQGLAKQFAALPKAMFVAMPVCALFVWGVYRSRVPFYVPHLYFAIHVHAAVFFILAVARLVNLAAHSIGAPFELMALIAFSSFVATFLSPLLAFHRVYGGRWASNFVRGLFVLVLYFCILPVVLGVIGAGRKLVGAD